MRIDPLRRLRTPVVARHVGRSSVERPRQTRRPLGAGVPDDSCCRPAAHLLLERDAALHDGPQPTELLEDCNCAMKDRPLDAGDFFMDPGVGFGGAGGLAQSWRTASARWSSSSVQTTTTERPCSARAGHRPRCAVPHERSAFAVLWPGST